jgi:hypothetical protein
MVNEVGLLLALVVCLLVVLGSGGLAPFVIAGWFISLVISQSMPPGRQCPALWVARAHAVSAPSP